MNHKFQFMIYNFKKNKSVKKCKSVWQCPKWICVCKWKKIISVWMTKKIQQRHHSHRDHMQRKVKKVCRNHINQLAD